MYDRSRSRDGGLHRYRRCLRRPRESLGGRKVPVALNHEHPSFVASEQHPHAPIDPALARTSGNVATAIPPRKFHHAERRPPTSDGRGVERLGHSIDHRRNPVSRAMKTAIPFGSPFRAREKVGRWVARLEIIQRIRAYVPRLVSPLRFRPESKAVTSNPRD